VPGLELWGLLMMVVMVVEVLLLLGRGCRVLQREVLLLLRRRSRDDDGAEALSEDRGGVHVPKTRGARAGRWGSDLVEARGTMATMQQGGDSRTKERTRPSWFVEVVG